MNTIVPVKDYFIININGRVIFTKKLDCVDYLKFKYNLNFID